MPSESDVQLVECMRQQFFLTISASWLMAKSEYHLLRGRSAFRALASFIFVSLASFENVIVLYANWLSKVPFGRPMTTVHR